MNSHPFFWIYDEESGDWNEPDPFGELAPEERIEVEGYPRVVREYQFDEDGTVHMIESIEYFIYLGAPKEES